MSLGKMALARISCVKASLGKTSLAQHLRATGLRLRPRLGDFACRASGTAAIEFAMVLPVMLTAYIGSVEIGGAVTADRKLANLSLTLANLSTRLQTSSSNPLQDTDVNSIFNASAAVLTPYNSTQAGMVITSFVFSTPTDGSMPNAFVVWSNATGPGATAMTPSCTTPISTSIVPANIRTPGGSVILGQATFPYNPAIGKMFTGTIKLQESNFMVPRYVVSVGRTNSSTSKTYSTCSGSNLA